MFKFKLIVILLIFLIGLFGCYSSITGTNLASKNEKLTKDSLLAGNKEPLPNRPLLGKQDFQELFTVSTKFFEAVRSGNKQRAIELFLPETTRTAKMLVAKDIELAAEQPADYAPKAGRYVWYQNGKLWNGGEGLDDNEVDRLSTLSRTYKKAAIIIIEQESGKVRKMLAVRHNRKYFLLP